MFTNWQLLPMEFVFTHTQFYSLNLPLSTRSLCSLGICVSQHLVKLYTRNITIFCFLLLCQKLEDERGRASENLGNTLSDTGSTSVSLHQGVKTRDIIECLQNNDNKVSEKECVVERGGSINFADTGN